MTIKNILNSQYSIVNIFAIIMTFLIFSISCKEESVEKQIIRPLVQLQTSDIPFLNGMTQSYFGETPFGVSQLIPETYNASYYFRWKSDSGNFVDINIWVAESKELAFDVFSFLHKLNYTSLLEDKKDEPAEVGDLSYSHGQAFVRDNLFVSIRTSEKFENLISEIAQYIDSKILKSQTFTSVSEIKPVIKDFKISKNPVIEQTQTPLTIQVEDPNGTNITYHWIFHQTSGYGNITKDNQDNYYYYSSWANENNNEIELTLVIVNAYGFCSDSTIKIQVVKK